jgi:hypothetical protein
MATGTRNLAPYNMKSLIKISLFSVFSFFLLSCGGGDGEKPIKTDVTFLKKGTRYTFQYKDNLFDGTIESVVEEQIGQDTFLVRNTSEEVTSIFPSQYWVLHDDNLYTSFRLRDPDTYQIECKFNKPVGTSWNVFKGTNTYAYTIDALNVTIKTVSKGDITDAIKIKIQTGSVISYQYVSPTVGPLGDGSADDDAAKIKVVDYTIGTINSPDVHVPPISFGSFPFLKVNNYWTYDESSFFGDDVVVKLEIVSKEASKNVYKVKLTYGETTPTYSYWYEDGGMLMVYEDGEAVENADAIYMNASDAEIGYGWAGLTGTSTYYIYKISSLNESMDTYFGELPCMGIDVSNGLFSTQINYWNQNKGNVSVSGLIVSRDITSSNARGVNKKTPFIPIIGISNAIN